MRCSAPAGANVSLISRLPTLQAARELRERLTGVLGPAAADAMTLGTFHSLCLAMLRRDIAKLQPELPYRPGFAMYDADDAVKVVREVMAEMGVVPPKQAAGAAKGARGWTPWQVQSAISAAKNYGGSSRYGSNNYGSSGRRNSYW